MQSLEFARRYGDQGIVFVSCNPGNLKTELQRNMSKIRETLLVSLSAALESKLIKKKILEPLPVSCSYGSIDSVMGCN